VKILQQRWIVRQNRKRERDGMAASIKRIIRKALPEIVQSSDATTGERLEACRLLLKILASAAKGKPRGRTFAKKANGEAKDQRERLDRLINPD
jgi:hypothetical protein